MIVQSDFSIFLETGLDSYEQERDFLALFAQLEKSPEYIHTYRITLLSLWNAAAVGVALERIFEGLDAYSRFPVPENVKSFIRDYYQRYGRVKIRDFDEGFYLLEAPEQDRVFLRKQKKLVHILDAEIPEGFLVARLNRGTVKQALMDLDPAYPVEDLAAFRQGDPLPVEFSENWEVGI